MIVKNLNEIIGTERDVHGETWNSRRLLLAGENMGFSMHDTVIHAGTETTYPIGPGTLYALNEHDRHCLRATTQLRMVCVFNPPVTGREVHNVNGAYPAATVAET